MPEKDALGLVGSKDFQLKPLYTSILIDAKRLGIAALEWVKTNGLEFFEKFCAAAQLASNAKNSRVKAAGALGSSICLTDKTISRLPKLEAHLRKLHEAKPSGSVSSSSSIKGAPHESAQAPKNVALHEKQKVELRREMQAPHVEDASLKIIIGDNYKPTARVGSGSTADAVRYEIKTGEPVGDRFHIQKSQQTIRMLEKWLRKNPTARPGDRAAAENILRDVKEALGE